MNKSNENQTILRDATVFEWSFSVGSDNRRTWNQEVISGSVFKAATQNAEIWCGSQGKLGAMPTGNPRNLSVRLCFVPWNDVGSQESRCLEARTLLDSNFIRTASTLDGVATGESWRKLRNSTWHDSCGSEFAFARLITADYSPPAEWQQLMVELELVASEWFNLSLNQFLIHKLDFGVIVVPCEGANEEVILLSEDTDSGSAKRDELIHRILPSLFLARVKVCTLVDLYESNLHPNLEALERELDRELRAFSCQPNSLQVLERSSFSIANMQSRFSESISQCEELRETLETNIANVERLLKAPVFNNCREQLYETLVPPLKDVSSQVSTDLRYMVITYDQADRVLNSINAMAEVRAGFWERRTTLLLGTFAAMALAQVFPDSPFPTLILDVQWKLALVFLGCLAVYWWSFWIDRKQNGGSHSNVD